MFSDRNEGAILHISFQIDIRVLGSRDCVKRVCFKGSFLSFISSFAGTKDVCLKPVPYNGCKPIKL